MSKNWPLMWTARCTKLLQGSKTVDSLKVAVLAALNIVDELFQERDRSKKLDSLVYDKSVECSRQLDQLLKRQAKPSHGFLKSSAKQVRTLLFSEGLSALISTNGDVFSSAQIATPWLEESRRTSSTSPIRGERLEDGISKT